jgi:hypothetical protein
MPPWRSAGGHGPYRSMAVRASAAARLLRAYATQVETLRRLRSGGSQIVRVEHVHVNEGGQATIGNVKRDGAGGANSALLNPLSRMRNERLANLSEWQPGAICDLERLSRHRLCTGPADAKVATTLGRSCSD